MWMRLRNSQIWIINYRQLGKEGGGVGLYNARQREVHDEHEPKNA